MRFKGERTVHALNGVDITLQQGEVLGLLGEVGLGQERHLARAAAHAAAAAQRDHPARSASRGEDVLTLDEDGLEKLRGGTVSMIFQEPMLALDPVYTIGDQIAETVVRHLGVTWARRPPARAGHARGGAHPVGEAAARGLSARDVRRHAPARHDRARALVQAESPARRRADHRARRDRADPDPAAAARTAARDGHGGDLRHPRHRRGGGNLRPSSP